MLKGNSNRLGIWPKIAKSGDFHRIELSNSIGTRLCKIADASSRFRRSATMASARGLRKYQSRAHGSFSRSRVLHHAPFHSPASRSATTRPPPTRSESQQPRSLTSSPPRAGVKSRAPALAVVVQAPNGESRLLC
jgi:hypothetical protein